MSENYKIGESNRPHFITMTIVDWVDLLTRPVYKDILTDSLNYCIKNKGLMLYAYCIMPSHVHIIVGSSNVPLNEIIRDYKKFTSKLFVTVIKNDIESRRECLPGPGGRVT